MIQPKTVLEDVRAGYGYKSPYNARSYLEYLEDFVEMGMVDQEDAHLAIIEGTRKRAKTVLRGIQIGFKHASSGTGKTYGEELRELVNRRYIDQEDAHLALCRGGVK